MIHARDVTRTFRTKAGAVEAVLGLNLTGSISLAA